MIVTYTDIWNALYDLYYLCAYWPMTSQNKSTVNIAFVISLSQKPSVQLEARHRHSAVMAGCVTGFSEKLQDGYRVQFILLCDL